MKEFKYKGRKVRIAKLLGGSYAYEIKGRKGERIMPGFARAWTAKRGAIRAINRQEA